MRECWRLPGIGFIGTGLVARLRNGEQFADFAERVGTGRFEELVKDLAMPVEFSLETMNEFIDWQRKVPFQVIRGEGECAI